MLHAIETSGRPVKRSRNKSPGVGPADRLLAVQVLAAQVTLWLFDLLKLSF